MVAAALIIGWGPHALVTGGVISANGNEGWFNLPLVLVPLALAWRIGARR